MFNPKQHLTKLLLIIQLLSLTSSSNGTREFASSSSDQPSGLVTGPTVSPSKQVASNPLLTASGSSSSSDQPSDPVPPLNQKAKSTSPADLINFAKIYKPYSIVGLRNKTKKLPSDQESVYTTYLAWHGTPNRSKKLKDIHKQLELAFNDNIRTPNYKREHAENHSELFSNASGIIDSVEGSLQPSDEQISIVFLHLNNMIQEIVDILHHVQEGQGPEPIHLENIYYEEQWYDIPLNMANDFFTYRNVIAKIDTVIGLLRQVLEKIAENTEVEYFSAAYSEILNTELFLEFHDREQLLGKWPEKDNILSFLLVKDNFLEQFTFVAQHKILKLQKIRRDFDIKCFEILREIENATNEEPFYIRAPYDVDIMAGRKIVNKNEETLHQSVSHYVDCVYDRIYRRALAKLKRPDMQAFFDLVD